MNFKIQRVLSQMSGKNFVVADYGVPYSVRTGINLECMEKAGSQRQPTCTSSPDPSMVTDRLFADSRYHTLPNQRRSVLDKTALLIAICGKS
ncbi:hypothetical protein EVAR_31829_1 [Eumeta japonica]|uniref:Uncharacterized protein n=1 Tax=Eumeta variegata TaxID=151549 RepID=A0A4C1WLV8_EUMVA|nr:hypothetical protein EVAR_31829_1 [Eumeta japonica]